MRSTAVAVIVFASVASLAQSPTPSPPAFEVASVRPAEPGCTPGGVSRPVGGLVQVRCATALQLILYAYDVMPIQRHDPEPVGGPQWIDRERFTVTARGPGDLSFPDARRMMQSLLEERFNLRARTEARDVPVYALVVARTDGRLGSGLRPSRIDCSAYSATLAATGRGAVAREVAPQCGLTSGGAPAVAATLGIANNSPRGSQMVRGTATIAELVTAISGRPGVDRKILDRTGLTGTFDIELTWTPAQAGTIRAAPEDVVSIFTAMQEQLGLKLEPERAALDVVVIDSMERPAPN